MSHAFKGFPVIDSRQPCIVAIERLSVVSGAAGHRGLVTCGRDSDRSGDTEKTNLNIFCSLQHLKILHA